jgi:hypothetical protein
MPVQDGAMGDREGGAGDGEGSTLTLTLVPGASGAATLTPGPNVSTLSIFLQHGYKFGVWLICKLVKFCTNLHTLNFSALK